MRNKSNVQHVYADFFIEILNFFQPYRGIVAPDQEFCP